VTVLASDDPYGVFVFSDSNRPVRLPEGHTLVILTIHRQRGLMGKVRVTYGTLSEADTAPFMTLGVGRASEGNDFVPLLESVVFTANQSEANVTLRVLDDDDPERDESVFVELISVNLIEGEQERRSKSLPHSHVPTMNFGAYSRRMVNICSWNMRLLSTHPLSIFPSCPVSSSRSEG
jgi:G-protein coupled receptor 98